MAEEDGVNTGGGGEINEDRGVRAPDRFEESTEDGGRGGDGSRFNKGLSSSDSSELENRLEFSRRLNKITATFFITKLLHVLNIVYCFG